MMFKFKKSQGGRGFTLIELLMVISIIAILATLSIAIIRGAEDDARASRTATVVGLVRNVIQDRLDGYEGRTLQFRFADMVPSVTRWDEMRTVRKTVLAEWFIAEMPVNFADLQVFPKTAGLQLTMPIPSSMVKKLRRHFNFPNPDLQDAGTPGPAGPTTQFEDAECLYAILYNTWDGDRRGTHFLSSSEIGDTDDDGFLEVLDAWGDPLVFSVTPLGQIFIDTTNPPELHDYQILVESRFHANQL